MRLALGLTVLLLWCAPGVRGNPVAPGSPPSPMPMQPPPPRWRPVEKLELVPVESGDRATRLRLPASLVRQASGAALRPQPRLPLTNTVMAGVALAVALALGGLWLVRRLAARRLAGLAGAAVALLLVLNLSGCPRPPDVPPPPPFNPTVEKLTPLARRADGALTGGALLESDNEDTIRLTLDRADLLTFLEKAGAVKARP
jgi:hypothetical protein